MAPNEFRFRELIDEPLGPYPDSAILSSSFPPPGFLPTLECLTLERGDDEWIGLDDTEFVMPPSETNLVAKIPVYFYGTLKIESLDWLSPEGLTRLENELRIRDQELHPRLHKSQLTLQNVYGNAKGRGSMISVIVQCKKSMFVEYMTCEYLRFCRDFPVFRFRVLTTFSKRINIRITFSYNLRLGISSEWFSLPNPSSDYPILATTRIKVESTKSSPWMAQRLGKAKILLCDIGYGR